MRSSQKCSNEQYQEQAPEKAHALHTCRTKPALGSVLSICYSFARDALLKTDYRSSGRKEWFSCESGTPGLCLGLAAGLISSRLCKPYILTRLSSSILSGYNQPGRTYLTDEIGTLGCEASPNLYGVTLNRRNGVRPVRYTLNRRISLSRPTLPTKRKRSGGV
jgi:hypothetical protein